MKKLLITILLILIFSFILFSCAPPQIEMTEEPPILETEQEEIVETSIEEIEVEEVIDPIQEKISEHGLEGLMEEIKQRDLKLYDHYTTGDTNTFFTVLKNISQYIPYEKFLERRPTIESLVELDSIISEFSNNKDKRIYVEKSFKKELVIIANLAADFSPASTIILMDLCERLNKEYQVLDNTTENNEYFKWFKNYSGMWGCFSLSRYI